MKVRITSISNFLAFLKKLKSVSKSAILEITKDKIFAKVHTPDKCTMKYSGLDFSEVFEGDIDWGKIKGDRVKIGIIDISKFMESFRYFRPEEDVFIEITTENVDGSVVATEMKIKSPSLNIRVRCGVLSLLSYVEDAILDMVLSKEDEIAKFKIYQSDFNTILSICGLENNSDEILVFRVGDNVYAKGDSFEYLLNISPAEISGNYEPNIYKNHLSYMEPETCTVYVHESRMVFFSEQTDTSIAIGLVEK
jgi:hypothetical protein